MLRRNLKLFFAFLPIVVINLAKSQTHSDDLGSQNHLKSDVLHDLTDSDLKLALKDLSLKDLKALQSLIDAADYHGLDYQGNIDTGYNRQEFDHSKDNLDVEDYDADMLRDNENILVNQIKHRKAFNPFTQENQRVKRNEETLNSKDEYIQQLVYSFPRNNIERQKLLIRVKRN